ncbi:ATP-binding protein [uncultured Nocardioides sp.]|uniref:AAA family ATPase n=1 Tax=uncultured Nocardioides sp. TaxID=198441 RepID=UPI002631777F|nr:ATP-binding protein [uncultured Nocardioides sp.]
MILSIEVDNFKTLRSARVDFGRMTMILGANGAGKSNLFDALRFLKAVGDGRSVRDAIEGHASPSLVSSIVSGVRGGGAAVSNFMSDSREFSIRARVWVDGQTLTYYVRVDAERYRVVQEELRATEHPGTYVYSTQPETGAIEQDPESPVVVARFHKATRGINPRRDFSPYDFILSQFVSRRAESRVNEEAAHLVRAEFASIGLLELRPEVLRQYSPLGRTDLGEHGENFAAVVWQLVNDATRRVLVRRTNDQGEEAIVTQTGKRAARESLAAINAWLNELSPVPIDSVTTVQAPTGEAIFAIREAEMQKEIAAPSLSDGTLRFAALALAAVGSSGRHTLVVEELENGISPARLSLLVQMLEQTTEASDGQLQVIASTHSPTLLDFASPRTIDDSVIFGWDPDEMASKPIAISKIPALREGLKDRTLGDLQEEGWLQFAADAET